MKTQAGFDLTPISPQHHISIKCSQQTKNERMLEIQISSESFCIKPQQLSQFLFARPIGLVFVVHVNVFSLYRYVDSKQQQAWTATVWWNSKMSITGSRADKLPPLGFTDWIHNNHQTMVVISHLSHPCLLSGDSAQSTAGARWTAGSRFAVVGMLCIWQLAN